MSKENADVCHWLDDCEYWATDCGNAFSFIADGPKENQMNYCCYCGKPIVEVSE